MKFLAILLLLTSTTYALESGDLLFVQNSHNLVENYTKSTYSHVAIVIKDNQQIWVYEASPPVIKKYTLDDWLDQIGQYNLNHKQSPAVLKIVSPNWSYSDNDIFEMKCFLEKHLGRRYSIRGYVRGVKTNGIHCSEMCAGALESTGKIDFLVENMCISPGDLDNMLSTSHHLIGRYLLTSKKYDSKLNVSVAWYCWETLRFFP